MHGKRRILLHNKKRNNTTGKRNMSKYNNEYSESESSNFNEAQWQINRLHNSWINCKHYRTKGDLFNWRWELETIWSELRSDAKRIKKDIPWEDNEYNIKTSALDKAINISVRISNAKLLYDLLDRKEKHLRWLQDDAGKGGSYDEGRKGIN
jgi:hypothetical protein